MSKISVLSLCAFFSFASFSWGAVIITQPGDVVARVGEKAVFTISAAQDSGVTYQWYANDSLVTGATSDVLVINIVTRSMDGDKWYCIVTADGEDYPSNSAYLKVVQPTRETITLSGDLKARFDGSGLNSLVNVKVELYEDKTGGSPIYSEKFYIDDGNGVKVENGLFTIRLGEGVTSHDLALVTSLSKSLYAQFKVGNSVLETLEPRLALTSVPYSLSTGANVLYGEGVPDSSLGEVPIGTYYVNETAGSGASTYIKTQKNWVGL